MKRIFLTALQAFVTLFLLWWIFRDGEKRELMFETLRNANWWWFLPGFFAVGLTSITQTWRWQWLMGVHGIHPSFRRSYGMNMIGWFFNLFLSGGTGGDLVKMYYATREAPGKRPAAVLSVFMDRVIGLLALIILAALISALDFRELWAARALHPLLLSLLLIVCGAVAIVGISIVVDRFHLANKLPNWLPLRRVFLELAAAFSKYARSPLVLLASLAVSIPTHLLFFFSFYTASRALGADLTIGQLFVLLPIVLTISALPISVAGLGVREQLFKVCLGALYGTPAGVAVLIGFSGFMIMVSWGVIGGIIYIFYRPSGADMSLSRMTHEMEALEEEIEREEVNG